MTFPFDKCDAMRNDRIQLSVNVYKNKIKNGE